MPTGWMFGPYARQITHGTQSGEWKIIPRLKFWFAFRPQKGGPDIRYEAVIGQGDSTLAIKRRPYYGSPAPKYTASFHEYRLPEDMELFDSLFIPRGETLSNTCFALLRGEDIADVTRMRLLGVVPTSQAWQPTGDTPCTSNLLL